MRFVYAAGALLLTVPSVLQSQIDPAAAVADLEFRSIGPAIMGGRIADLAVVESHPQVFYVGTASGGLWKTESDGTVWESIFDDQATSSIGDVTLAPSNPNVVWVGTGEPQNRQSSPWGNGVYKSLDAGRTWQHMGMEETRHIGRIVIHPRDPDVVYVAAVGHLWGPNPERGVYRTTDGGKTWDQVLFVDESTGAIDLAMDPGDPRTLYAAMYQRQRTGWGFNGGGPGSGLYRSLDGGATWTELTDGLPEGDKGRIGIDVYRGDGNLVYALVEADARAPGAGFGGGSSGSSKGGLFRSTDRGATWERMSTTNPRPMYYSQVRIDPTNPDRIYVLGTSLSVSDDGGKTFRNDAAERIHVDHHALWIDPSDPDHVILGSDGGVAASRDGAESWRMFDNLPIGQFYQIGLDMRDPYYVCGGLQDNDNWCGPSRTLNIHGIRNQDWYEVWGGDGFYNVIDPTDHTIVYTESQGGNVGRYDVVTGEKISLRPIPEPRAGGDTSKTYRFNWNSPILISHHDPATVYLGANHLMRTPDRGHTWEEVGPDLTKQIDRTALSIMGVVGSEAMMSPNDGISSYGNITTIAESPLTPHVLYVGTDDGNVQVTRDGGATWENVVGHIAGVPERTYASRLVASRHAEGRVYATFDGHRNDDYAAHVFVSEDYGRRWRRITTRLPDGASVNVIVEHHRSPNLLFVGNEVGAYVSVDRGERWVRLKNNLPTVPVDDIQIHPRDNDLVLGTHGRSVWILHDLTPFERMSDQAQSLGNALLPVQPAIMWSLQGDWPFPGATYAAGNPPVAARIRYHLVPAAADTSRADSVEIQVVDAMGEPIRTLTGPGGAGFHEVLWDFRYDAPPSTPGLGGGFGGTPSGPRVLPGTYTARFGGEDLVGETSIEVRPEPRRAISDADRLARQQAILSVSTLAKPLRAASGRADQLTRQLGDAKKLIGDQPKASEAVAALLDTLQTELGEVRRELGRRTRSLRLIDAMDGATVLPTADQRWQIDDLWRTVPDLIARLNVLIEQRIPAFNRMLDAEGVRPAPGAPIALPRKP
ncbi:MAG TPA: hypothetical protein VGA22_09900 [Gemmatimonadales bacterium]|jgi:photosystem II stability/assembly factor-like uncharacterized protein